MTTGALAGLAGCSGILGSDGSEDPDDSGGSQNSGGPAEAVETFYETAARGDVEAVNDRIHPDSPLGEFGADDAEAAAEMNIVVEGTGVEERSGDSADVTVTLSADDPESGDRETAEQVVRLRRVDGEWLLYDTGSAGSADPSPPQVLWDVEERYEDGATVAVEFTHDGGEAVDVAALSVRAGGETADPGGATGDLTAGDVITVPFDGDGDPLSSGTDVNLDWSSAEADGWSVIGRHTLVQETAAGLGDQFEV